MRITVKEAATILNGTPGWVRSLCDRGKCGDSWGNGTARKTYVIVPSKLSAFMQIDERELLMRVNALRESRSVDD